MTQNLHVDGQPESNALKLNRPISLEGEPGAALKFQAETRLVTTGTYPNLIHTWWTFDSSIKIQSSHVQIRDLTLDFPNEVFYTGGLEKAAAILISTTNETQEVQFQDQLVNVNLIGLHINGPKPSGETEVDRNAIPERTRGKANQFLIRTSFASGTISGNEIVGGSIQLTLGPWTVTNNKYFGPKQSNKTYPIDGKTNSDGISASGDARTVIR
jgi:hypothetical protein